MTGSKSLWRGRLMWGTKCRRGGGGGMDMWNAVALIFATFCLVLAGFVMREWIHDETVSCEGNTDRDTDWKASA